MVVTFRGVTGVGDRLGCYCLISGGYLGVVWLVLLVRVMLGFALLRLVWFLVRVRLDLGVVIPFSLLLRSYVGVLSAVIGLWSRLGDVSLRRRLYCLMIVFIILLMWRCRSLRCGVCLRLILVVVDLRIRWCRLACLIWGTLLELGLMPLMRNFRD